MKGPAGHQPAGPFAYGDIVADVTEVQTPEVIEGEIVEPPKKRGRPRKAASNGQVAVLEEKWVEPDQDWPHEWIEFKGDRLAVRKPTIQAVHAYINSQGRFVPPQMQNDLGSLFMVRAMSSETYARVMDRFMNGDDPDYDENSVGELMRMIVEMTTADLQDNRKARRATPKT